MKENSVVNGRRLLDTMKLWAAILALVMASGSFWSLWGRISACEEKAKQHENAIYRLQDDITTIKLDVRTLLTLQRAEREKEGRKTE